MANIVLMCFPLFYRLTWVQRCWSRATPDFGSVSVTSSFLLQDIPKHPDTRLFEVREAFKRSFVAWFSGAYTRIYRFFFASGGPCGGLDRLRRATDAEPLINALVRGTGELVPA